MLHSEVFEKYKSVFYRQVPSIDVWHPNGFNSIRIRLFSGDEYVFSYLGECNWRMETLESFMEYLSKNKLNGGN